jgi:choline dehydrogenase-like flavoprotein
MNFDYIVVGAGSAGNRVLLLGGTSSINGQMYSRGNAGDFDGWAHAGLAAA